MNGTNDITNMVVSIADIKPHPDNYNKHPEKQLQQLGASYESLGQFRSVVLWQQADGSYIQLAGHGVVDAMKREGATEVRADVFSSSLDAMTAKRILLADNLHAQNSESDNTILAELLDEQRNSGHDLASVGFTDQELDALLENLGSQLLDPFPGDNEDLLDITDASPSVEALKQLKFGKYLIQMTDEEFDALSKRLEAYATETGSHFGFVGSLLNV